MACFLFTFHMWVCQDELKGSSPSSSWQRQQRHGLQLVKESPESLPGSALLDFKQHLGAILSRVEQRKDQLEILTNLYDFYDSVSVPTAGICTHCW